MLAPRLTANLALLPALLPALLLLSACPETELPSDETETETGPPPSCLDTDPPGADIIIHSDADIEALALSGCVAERLVISGGAVTDLSGLSELRELGGLEIRYNPMLESLEPLAGLERVDLLILVGNAKLATLPTFPSLALGSVSISENDSLVDLGSFPAAFELTRLQIDNGLVLEDLSGFEATTAVSGDVIIESNTLLVDLTGLDGLSSVGQKLTIENNLALDTLAGLKVESVGDNLAILDNVSLSKCLVADFVDSVSVGGATLVNGNEEDLCD